ncbi:non-ribosomal peptide synthetase [Paenibacillus solani]|uniref:non-ribosomal peptide synthetase n=1 Tax=Paenibacillus solani TaxID=1705565 RepID=UPI0006C8B48D|nr:non-ribosomal peptide synthetase [Paenibacillus solani]
MLEEIHHSFSEALTERLTKLSKHHQVTMNSMMQTAWGMLLCSYNNTDDAVFGAVVSGRPAEIEGVENMVGLFINTLPVRLSPKEHAETFIETVKGLQQRARDSEKYDYISLAEIQAQSDLKQNLIDHLFIFQNYPEVYEISGQSENQDFQITDAQSFEHTNYSLSVIMHLRSNRLGIKIGFNASEHGRDNIERVISHLETILEQVSARPDMRLDEIELVVEEEKRHLLDTFNDTKAEYPKDQTIQALFEQQAERTPAAEAVVFESERLTYGELNAKANQLARVLRARGVGADRIVGIMADRSVEMIVGILAILKAGGAYLPIDPAYPAERIAYMLEDSGADLLLVYGGAQVPAAYTGEALYLADESLYAGDASNLPAVNGPKNMTYVIYTSGSTGLPKGVMITQQNLVNYISWTQKVYVQGDSLDFPLYSSIAFDLTVTSIFTPLVSGNRIVIYSDQDIVIVMERILTENKVGIVKLTPTHLSLLGEIPITCSNLKRIIVGGEQLEAHVARKFTSRCEFPVEIFNEYGPTETTVGCMIYRYDEAREGMYAVPIGKPADNAKIYVLDASQRPVPQGVPGEIYIGGEGLARGYLNRPELTTEKFVDNPFEPGERMYRTGDLARWLPDGNLEYMGRIDEQVKIRGYRIETGEIVHGLLQHADVKEAVVVARKDERGEAYLCAYVVSVEEFDASALRSYLKRSLPEYMVPSYLVEVERIPLTANGKVDRKALPEPQGLAQAGSEYVAPRSETEAKLAEIWQDVLGLSQSVGIRDNFFELGGHSLKATQLMSRIQKQLDASVPLGEVFSSPTVEELAGYLEVAATKERYEAIGKAEPREWYPASPAQQRLYVVSQLDPRGISYNIPWALEIAGELNAERVQESLNLLAAHHESFRTSFAMQKGELMQRIAERVEVALEVTESTEEEAKTRVKAFVRPFDLGEAPLLRAGLIRLEERRYVLLLDMHHIVSDGTSMDVFVDEFTRLYAGEQLAPLAIHYKDYAVWLREKMQGEAYQAQEQYWLQAFEEEAPVLQLPTDYERPAVRRFEGERTGQLWSEHETERLKQLCAKQGVTLYMALLAAYGVLLSRYAGQEDVVVGSPVAGRRHPDAERMIGMFVNTLAMRSRPTGSKRFDAYLAEVKAAVLGAMENQDYPFEELVEKAAVRRDMSRNPLFDTMLVLQNMQMSEWKPEGLTIRPYPQEYRIAKFDLTVAAVEQEGRLYFDWEYSTALFKQETVERMGKHLAAIVEQIVETPDIRLDEIELVVEEEKRQLLTVFNDTKAEYPKDQTIQALFEEQAERTPEAEAVVFESAEMTYGELNAKANKLARVLRGQGVGADRIVGIMAERSVEMIVGILAILKAGGAYLPIDPAYPAERIAYMLEDSGADLLLVYGDVEVPPGYPGQVLNLGDASLYAGDTSNLPAASGPNDMAYVIYTSGSTGQPKGVMVEHVSLVNLSTWHCRYFEVRDTDRATQYAGIGFDAAVWEIFPYLMSGAAIYLASPHIRTDFEALSRFYQENGITVSFLPTPVYEQFAEQPGHSLRALLTGGDTLGKTKRSGYRLSNNYGPTENTVVATSGWVEAEEGVPSIGKPIQNVRIYVVNQSNQLQPIGVPGELCIAGDGLARGYLNRPELTAEKFVDNPFEPGERMYRTGDLARWLPDGNLEYMGRIDEQVKIRGYRIETGEIVHRLLQYADVKESVVVARKDERGEAYLCAYVVSGGAFDPSELRSHLKRSLPEYMVPSYLVEVERIPLTANGKVDRRALPEPQGLVQAGSEYVAPRSETETKLAEIWQDVLGLSQPVGIRDNFFDLGGHSLKVIELVAVMREHGFSIEPQSIYKGMTIEEISKMIIMDDVLTEMESSVNAALIAAKAKEVEE